LLQYYVDTTVTSSYSYTVHCSYKTYVQHWVMYRNSLYTVKCWRSKNSVIDVL